MSDFGVANKNVFESKDIVKDYAEQQYLFEPERVILEKFRSEMKYMRMLDIGVGAGRTTNYFANLAKEYVGIDYSTGMINASKQRFRNTNANISFKVCDARSLTPFEDDYFDFVLFSFNGIDCIGHEDRLKAFREMHRVGKNGAFLFFSTHNLESIDNLFEVRLSIHPIKLIAELKRNVLIRILNKNPKKLKSMKYAVINDGVHDFRIKLYYIKPAEQIKQLEDSGFSNIVTYSLSEKETIGTCIWVDDWIYFLCNICK